MSKFICEIINFNTQQLETKDTVMYFCVLVSIFLFCFGEGGAGGVLFTSHSIKID